MDMTCVIPRVLITLGFLACSKFPKKIEDAKMELGIHGTVAASLLNLPLHLLSSSSAFIFFVDDIKWGNLLSSRFMPPRMHMTSIWGKS